MKLGCRSTVTAWRPMTTTSVASFLLRSCGWLMGSGGGGGGGSRLGATGTQPGACGLHASAAPREPYSQEEAAAQVGSAATAAHEPGHHLHTKDDVTLWNCGDFFAAAAGETAAKKLEAAATASVPVQGLPELALIVANYAIPKLHHHYFSYLWDKARVKVCADGGGNRLFAYDKTRFVPDIIAGDMDSLQPSVREYYRQRGTSIVPIKDQDTTDLEKCLLQIQDIEQRENRAFNICVVGGLGGNFSHELANVNILYKYHRRHIFLLSELNLSFLLVPGRHVIRTNVPLGPQDKRRIFCSLIPLGTKCRSITTKGLRWNLTAGSMEFGGLVSTSNEMAAESAEVEVSDPVLWAFDIRPEEEQRRTQHPSMEEDEVMHMT